MAREFLLEIDSTYYTCALSSPGCLFGMNTQRIRYTTNPGISGINEPTIKRIRTRVALQPSHSATPPQTPAMIFC
jgi:hypothetical protein